MAGSAGADAGIDADAGGVCDFGACADSNDCAGDSRCESATCVPYDSVVSNDPTCQRTVVPGVFSPVVQCEWLAPSVSGFANWHNVYATPMVADFDLDDDRSVLSPSIVFSSYELGTAEGVLVVLDGETCTEQAVLTDVADRLTFGTSPAIGDLDLAPDGRPEIVATGLDTGPDAAGLTAFKYVPGSGFTRLFYGRRCDLSGEPRHSLGPGTTNVTAGLSIHDLDDDGVPEILQGRFVYDSTGCLLNPNATFDFYLNNHGLHPVVSDVDNDGAPELVEAGGVYGWDATAQDWMLESFWSPPADPEAVRNGYAAVADFGDFTGVTGDAPGRPEIAVIANVDADTAVARVMTVAGHIVFGPFTLPNEPGSTAGRGGSPTVADFDGDGRPELGVAGASRYTVFDLDCDIAAQNGPGCTRAAGLPRGVLWSQRIQDVTSSITGSSVFDFDADGVAEVVYGDECFFRVFRGTDGQVLFSTSASHGTGLEYPVVADVDGDFNSEIVVPRSNLFGALTCPATDPSSPSTTFSESSGVMVLRDAGEGWAASRPIWNQHAYHVTHVADDGTIPRTQDWVANHSVSSLNNFRQNTQGGLQALGAADLTVALLDSFSYCGAVSGQVTLRANVCNRGSNPAAAGVTVMFRDAAADASAAPLCETVVPGSLAVGDCSEVSCTWTAPGGVVDLLVEVDSGAAVLECRTANNTSLAVGACCG